jgi:hypothetical protein
MAGTKVNTLPIAQNINGPATVQFANADGAAGTGLTTSPSNTKLLYTAGANDSVLKSIIVNTDEATTVRIVNIYVSPDSGTTKNWIGSVSIPLQSGNTGVISTVDVLGATVLPGMCYDQSGKAVLPLAGTYRIYVGLQVAVTSGKFVNVTAVGEDY